MPAKDIHKMIKEFENIKEEYRSYYDSLLKQGRLPMKDTGVGFWSAAPADEIFEAFRKMRLNNFKNFLDLGSGDGRAVLIASLFCNASGIEYDPVLVGKSTEIRDKLNIDAKFMHNDFHNYDISKHDVVFLNPDQPLHRGLEDKLQKELKGHLILFGNHFHPKNLKKIKSIMVNGTLVTLYSR